MEGDRSRGEVAGQKTRIISTEAAPNSNPRHLDRSEAQRRDPCISFCLIPRPRLDAILKSAPATSVPQAARILRVIITLFSVLWLLFSIFRGIHFSSSQGMVQLIFFEIYA
jgi:hypothetical protein